MNNSISLWRVEVTTPPVGGHISGPFVDWYDAADEAEALELAREDAHRYGLPESATFSARLATPEEVEATKEAATH